MRVPCAVPTGTTRVFVMHVGMLCLNQNDKFPLAGVLFVPLFALLAIEAYQNKVLYEISEQEDADKETKYDHHY